MSSTEKWSKRRPSENLLQFTPYKIDRLSTLTVLTVLEGNL